MLCCVKFTIFLHLLCQGTPVYHSLVTMHLNIFLTLMFVLLALLVVDAKKVPKQVKKDEDVEIVTDVEAKLKELNDAAADNKAAAKEEKKRRDETKKLEKESTEFTRKAQLAKESFGDISEERATMLHSLGRAVYKLGRFDEALEHSKGDILCFTYSQISGT